MASHYFGEIVVVHRKGYLTHSLSPGTSRNETAVIVGIGNLRNKSWIVQRLENRTFAPVERHNDDIMPLRLDNQTETLVSDLISKYKECMLDPKPIDSEQLINFRCSLPTGLEFPIPPIRKEENVVLDNNVESDIPIVEQPSEFGPTIINGDITSHNIIFDGKRSRKPRSLYVPLSSNIDIQSNAVTVDTLSVSPDGLPFMAYSVSESLVAMQNYSPSRKETLLLNENFAKWREAEKRRWICIFTEAHCYQLVRYLYILVSLIRNGCIN
jgi:hypothetical protein